MRGSALQDDASTPPMLERQEHRAVSELSSPSDSSCSTITNPRICFVTLGCAKNEVDSDLMMRQVQRVGWSVVDDPGDADAVVVNTCSFIEAAIEESIDTIFELAGTEDDPGCGAPIIVAGCMPARYGDDLEQELTEAAAFLACDKEQSIVQTIAQVLHIADPEEVDECSERKTHDASGSDDAPASNEASGLCDAGQPSVLRPSAYVKISDGCDRFCSYCTIPFIRGRYHSFTRADIKAEVAHLISQGTREIVLIAQDTGRWGDDFEEPETLASLLADLADSYPDTWFRVMYIQPEGISDDLLDVIASRDNIASYLDIPLQHVNEEILKAMNRSGSQAAYKALLARIRGRIPDVTLRTTLIAGFPGESDEAFDELCTFLVDADFDYVGVFPYSQEDGTRAANMEQQIDEETKLERAQCLRDIADTVSTKRIAKRVGATMEVLVLGHEEDGQLFGRAQCQAPDVDGLVFLDEGEIGEIRSVTICDTLLYDMEADSNV